METAKGREISHSELRELFLREGDVDVGFVEITRKELGDKKGLLNKISPDVRSIASIVIRLNRPNLLTPMRNLNSFEGHQTAHNLNKIQDRIIRVLRDQGVSAIRIPMAFPIDFTAIDGPDYIKHQPVAVQAGMGLMGDSGLLLHPKWGSAVFLSTILMNCTLDTYDQALTENPCIKCNICALACPTAAISKNGEFDRRPCQTHNYREATPGFYDFVDALVSSQDMAEFSQRFTVFETLSWGQSLLSGTAYKCNNCQAVCPAGTENIAQYRTSPKEYVKYMSDLFLHRPEFVYVTPGSKAEEVVLKNPVKKIRYVGKHKPDSAKN